MTAQPDAPASRPTQRRRPPSPRFSAAPRWRVATRLARRQVRRTKLSSLLVVVLIALPIAAMTAYAVFAASTLGTAQDKVRVELGQMQAWVAPVGVPDAGLWQAPTQPQWNGYPRDDAGESTFPDGVVPNSPVAALPTNTETVPLTRGMARVATRDGVGLIAAWAGDAWDPRFTGAFDLVDGARPSSPTEAMVTPATLARLGIPLGGELTFADGDDVYTVVGTLKAAALPSAVSAVFLPASDAALGRLSARETRWFLPSLALSWGDVQALNSDGVVAYSRDVLLDPPAELREEVRSSVQDAWMRIWPTVLVVSAGGVFAAYVVIMLAGAAFAVAARRQQRSLAVAASVGADRRDLSRTILLQGTTIGAVAGAVGLLLGLAVAAGAMMLVSDGSATQFWGFCVPWPGLGAIYVFAVVVGTLAALIPARRVARTDALGALRGARRPQKPTVARPLWGVVMLVTGIGITLACALTVTAVAVSDIAGDSPARYLPAYGIVLGPVLAQIGILLSGGWLLWVASRVLSRMGLAATLAARDAAANAGRTVPAFAAIAATVFVGIFAFGQSSMQTAQSARAWSYAAPVGSIAFSIWPGTTTTTGPMSADDATDGADAAVAIANGAGAAKTSVIALQQQTSWSYESREEIPEDLTLAIAVLPERFLLEPGPGSTWQSRGKDPDNPLSVISGSDVETALGITLSRAQLDAYRAGAAIVADDRFVVDGRIDLAAWPQRDFFAGHVRSNIWLPGPDQVIAAPQWEQDIPAIVVDAPLQPTLIALAPPVAERLGITTVAQKVIAELPSPPSTEDRDRLQAQVDLASGADFTLNQSIEQGPPSGTRWIIPLLSVVGVLVLGASAVALGLARFERRPDDATLAAVGGTPRLRRSIGFWQGLIIAGFGTMAGVAGILPPIGFAIASRGELLLGDVHWWLLGAFCLGLPLTIAVANWIVAPRRPDLSRRTVIA